VEAQVFALQRPLAQSLFDVQDEPIASNASHVPAVQLAPDWHEAVHGWPAWGSATQLPDWHVASRGSQVTVLEVEQVAPGGWRTTCTQTEFTQLEPAVAPPLAAGFAQDW
jgi:hypothetical protein